MGKPAATLGHNHACPAKTGKVPHVGGPIVAGCGTVFVEGVPAATVGHQLSCVGPPDVISGGSGSVYFEGKPAARMGDPCAHGGKIVAGCISVTVG